MTGRARILAPRHLAGLALTLLLAAGIAGLWRIVPLLVEGTVFQRVGNVVLLLAVLALLSLAERIWTALTALIDRRHPKD